MSELKVQSPLTEAHFNEFPVKSPEYFNFASDVVDRWAAYDRNKMAMIWVNQQGDEKRFTFFDFYINTVENNFLAKCFMQIFYLNFIFAHLFFST